MERHASVPLIADSESCRAAYRGLHYLSLISSVFRRVVPEWLNYHLLEDFSFFWSQSFMGGNMTRLLCAPPKDNRFLSFLHSERGRVVSLWVQYEPQQAHFLS